jgi:hypothetical protein
MSSIPSIQEQNAGDNQQEEMRMLDMINRIQMFQIAGGKVNQALIH